MLISYIYYTESPKFKGKGQALGRLQMRACVGRGESILCGLKKSSASPTTHFKSQVGPWVSVTPELVGIRRERQVDPESLLANQSGQFSELRGSVRLCLKN